MPENKNETGKIVWQDLTVSNADEIKYFYSKVIGWRFSPHNMGEYNDYEMKIPETDVTAAGICHARGSNAKLPPQWLIYVAVDDVTKCIELCIENGGKVVDGPRKMGKSDFCVIQDPAGAVIALISK
jgi:predicted enzyme related to lactoylglutathione lyase